MHLSAYNNAQRFYDVYNKSFADGFKVVEVGSQNVNGSMRPIFERDCDYTGLDWVDGKGVDIVLTEAYKFPIPDECADIITCSSAFEHSEMFWVTFLEVMRILKPQGLFYMNAPSNGGFHQFPVDCWRFFPDSGKAFVTWGKHNGYKPALLESFISHREGGKVWNDFTMVMVKDESYVSRYPTRILDTFENFYNGHKHGETEILNRAWLHEL